MNATRDRGAGTAEGIFWYAGILTPGGLALVGDIAIWEFGWNS